MFRGYWCIIFALIGWLILAAANHPDAERQVKATQVHQSIANSLGNIAATYHQETQRVQRSQRDIEPCQPGDDRRYSDLCAQWKAADAAAKSAWWAWASGVVGIGSLAGVIIALFVGLHANHIASNTAKHELRAYLTAQNIKAAQLSPAKSPKWEIQVVWANNGSTPAVAALANTNSAVFDGVIPEDFSYPDNPKPSQYAPLPIGPNQQLHSRAPFLLGADFSEIKRGNKKAFVWGWIEYQDIFSTKKRRTEFCYELGVEHDGERFGMAFIPAGPHNGMDDGCMKKPSA